MDALTQMETRAGSARGRSFFENSHKSQAQRLADFSAAMGGGGGGETFEVADDANESSAEQEQQDEGAQIAAESEQEQPEAGAEASEASRDDGMAVPSIDLENLERNLAASAGKKVAKEVVDGLARPLMQQLSGVAAREANARVERLVGKFGAVYPELKRNKAAVEAVVRVAVSMQKKGDTDEVAFQRGLHAVYGDRKAEMRQQTGHQMSAPGRTTATPTKYTREQADIAALEEYGRTGDVRAAQALKRKLLGG